MVKATVAAVITPDQGDPETVLLTRRNVAPFKGRWCLPGGHIDEGERAEEAVVREVLEETGLCLPSPSFLGYFDEIFPCYDFHAVALAFCGIGTGSLQPQEAEVAEMSWIPLHEALLLTLAFNHNTILHRYARSLVGR